MLLNTSISSSANCLMHISSLSSPWLAEPQLVINSWLISVKLLRADSNFIVIYCLLSTYLRHLSLQIVCILHDWGEHENWTLTLKQNVEWDDIFRAAAEWAQALVLSIFIALSQLNLISWTVKKTITKCQILIINN